jgi:hypothetical protein
MDARISAAVSSGSISATDQTALSTALDSIDSSLSADRASGTKPATGMKDRVDGLVDQQVKDGKLTDDQATELKKLFAQGPHGHHKGAGGPPPADLASSATDGSSDSTSSTDGTASIGGTAQEMLMAFLQQLRSQLGSSDTYDAKSANSTASSGTAASGLIVDTKV